NSGICHGTSSQKAVEGVDSPAIMLTMYQRHRKTCKRRNEPRLVVDMGDGIFQRKETLFRTLKGVLLRLTESKGCGHASDRDFRTCRTQPLRRGYCFCAPASAVSIAIILRDLVSAARNVTCCPFSSKDFRKAGSSQASSSTFSQLKSL